MAVGDAGVMRRGRSSQDGRGGDLKSDADGLIVIEGAVRGCVGATAGRWRK